MFEISYVSSYKKHGCDFSGNLGVIDCSQQLIENTRYGQFGSMIQFDIADNALAHMKDKHPDCNFTILLGLPDLVVRFD